MSFTSYETQLGSGMGTELPRLDHEVVELPLLLPRWQAQALEEVARNQGMTTGQMLRRLVGEVAPENPGQP